MTTWDEHGGGRLFVDACATRLGGALSAQLSACLNLLSEEEIWHQPNASSNSVGNIVLHMCGNMRQWIISAVGDRPDVRRRREEFAPESRMPKADLLRLARETLAEAAQTLSRFDPSRLTEEVVIQTRRRTRLGAILEAIEHFSHHLGQVIYATKLAGKDPEFYDLSDEARAKHSGES